MPGEVTPPLTFQARAPEDDAPDGQPADSRVRRRKRRRPGLNPDWERSGGSRHGGDADRSASKWWLIGGGVGLCSVIVAVFALMKGLPHGPGGPGTVAAPPNPAAAGSGATPQPAGGELPLVLRSDAEFLGVAEPLAARFMAARTVDELLPLVRNRESVEPRIRAMHPDGSLTPYGYPKFNTQDTVVNEGALRSVIVANADFEEKVLAFEETREGVLIDWESWVGWSEMTAKDFMTTKPAAGKLFRVVLSSVEYYNFAFADETRWRSFRLTLPDGETMLYGYAERGSAIDSRMRLPAEVKQAAFTLKLKYPEDSGPSNQVIIESVVADGWVVTNPTNP